MKHLGPDIAMAWLGVLLLVLAGCSGERLPTGYGRVNEPSGMPIAHFQPSVNGTRVLAGMFRDAGHDVETLDRLSERLNEFDCVVWFTPDSVRPSQRMIDLFEGWLGKKPGRSVIYVGRGYDAAIDYWQEIEPRLEGKDAADTHRRREEARQRRQAAEVAFAFSYLAELGNSSQTCDWFIVEPRDVVSLNPSKDGADRQAPPREGDRDEDQTSEDRSLPRRPEDADDWPPEGFRWIRFRPPHRVAALSGDEAWVRDVHPAQARIVLYDRMIPVDEMEVLLDSEDGFLVGSLSRGGGQVVVVANGSFLLNLPLVNPEHRKLAGRLIARIGEDRRKVCFLQARDFRETRETSLSMTPVGLTLLMVWPANIIFFHLLFVGIVLVFHLFPIFGRARRAASAEVSDFGKHLDALGDLLSQSADLAFARGRYEQYLKRADEKKLRR